MVRSGGGVAVALCAHGLLEDIDVARSECTD